MKTIKYKAGYKYKLVEADQFKTPIKGHTAWHKLFSIGDEGSLFIDAGYAWDGPSGTTFDTKNAMRASLVHDCGYQMMAEGMLPQSTREAWDKLFYEILLEDGMPKWRAKLWYWAVCKFGGKFGNPKHTPNPILSAPIQENR